MVKFTKRKTNEMAPSVSNQSSLFDSSNSATPVTTSNINLSINTIAAEDDDVENGNHNKQSSVWKYATKIDSEKARCNICKHELSRKGQSTSTIRRHLFLVHKIKEFESKHAILANDRPKSANNLSVDQKRKLRELAVNAIVKDGRSFNDLNKPGITKLFDGLLGGFRAPHRNTVKRSLKRLNTLHVKKLIDQLDDTNFTAITTDFWCDRNSKSYLCITGHWYNDDMVMKSKVLVFTPYFDRHTSENIASQLDYQLKQLKIFDKVTTITCDGASNMKASFRLIDSRIKRLQCLAHKLHLIVCNALGLWVKPDKEIEEQETDGDYNSEDNFDSDVRSLSLNYSYNDDDTSAEDDEDERKYLSDNEQDSDEEADSDQYFSSDVWGLDVNTDVKSATELQGVIGDVLYKCRSTIKMINKSSNLTSYIDRLKETNGIQHGFSIDCKSRWNSTKYMVHNILDYKLLINLLHSNKHDLKLTNKQKQDLTNLELSTDEWLIIKSIDRVLAPFCEATTLMSGSRYTTIGTALFAIRRIKSFLESHTENNYFMNEMNTLLLQQMIKYIDDDVEQLELITFLAYFDPLGFSVLSQKERTTVERSIKQLLKDIDDDIDNTVNKNTVHVNLAQGISSSAISQFKQTTPSKVKSRLSSFLQSVSTSTTKEHSSCATTNKTNSIADEFLLYKTLATKQVQNIVEHDLNSDANDFWRVHGTELPQLKYLAKRHLCTPATSVPSESAFSVASNLGRQQRARLNPRTLSMTVFLKDKIDEPEY